MKMRTKPTRAVRRRGAPLPDDACPSCGTQMKEARGRMSLPVNGEPVSVSSVAHLKCSECGEVVLRFTDAKRFQEDAIAAYRKKHGLLSADEIRNLRDSFGLTQAGLARLLRLGGN